MSVFTQNNTMLWLTRRVGVSALFLIPLAPLAVYLGFLFPYMSGRNFFFRALMLAALAAWILLWVQKPERYRPRMSFLSAAVLIFVVAVGIATALSQNPSFAFWSSLERMDGFISVIFLAAFFFSAPHLFNARRWNIFFHISLGTTLVVSVVSILQLLGILEIHQGGVRTDATFGNASFFAVYMLLSFGLALFLAAGARSLRSRLAYIFCSALFIFLSLASGTRSAFVAILATLFVSGIAAFFLRAKNANIKRFYIVSITALALVVGVFFSLRQIPSAVSHPLLGRLLSVSLASSDTEARFLAWGLALRGAAERPFFGWGPEGFRTVFIKYYDPRLAGREQWFDRAHNTYLDWLVQAGALGLLAYLAIWFGLARAVWRRDSAFAPWKKVALSGMFAGYAAFNVFSFDTITASILFFAFLAFAESHIPPTPLERGSLKNPPLREVSPVGRRRMFFAFLVGVFTLFIFYFTIAKPGLSAYLISQGLRNPSPDLDTRLAFFTRAVSLNTFATPEAREFLAQFAVDVYSAEITNESRKKIITLTAQELARQVEETPNDPRYLLRLGATLNTYREYQAAVPILEQAVTLSPRKQPSLYELGTSYLNLGKFDDAAAVFKRAAELLPDHEDLESKRLYAVSLVYASRFAEAEKYMQKIFGTPIFWDARLADAYRRAGMYDKMNEILENVK